MILRPIKLGKLKKKQLGFLLNPSRFSSSVPVPGDVLYPLVKLLLHGEGTPGGTVFTDNSGTPKTVTAVGSGITTSNTYAAFGTTSISFPGGTTANYLSVASNPDFAFSADYTIEFVARWNGITAGKADMLCGTIVSSGLAIYWDGGKYNSNKLVVSNYAVDNPILYSFVPTLNQAYRIAVSRVGTTVRLLVDGAVVATATMTTVHPQGELRIGGNDTSASGISTMNGFIDELRITNGIARYTAAYTVSPIPFYDFAPVNAFNSTVYSDSPSCWWKMDDASGNLTDYSGNSRTGSPSGTITYGQAGLFANTGTAINAAAASQVTRADWLGANYTSTGFTIECVFTVPNLGIYHGLGGRHGSSAVTDWSIVLRVNPSNALEFGIVTTNPSAAGFVATSANGIIAANTPYHVMAWWQPGVGLSFRLNGGAVVFLSTTSTNLRNIVSGGGIIAAASVGTDATSAKKIDEFIFYSTYLIGANNAIAHYNALTARVMDTFTRANSSTTLGTADTLQTWTAHTGTWGINTNKAALITQAGDSVATINTLLADFTLNCDFTFQGDGGIIFRAIDDQNYLLLLVQSTGALEIFSRIAGAYTSIGAAVTGQFTAGQTKQLTIVCAGTSIISKIDGVVKHTITSSQFQTATRCGLRQNAAATTANRWDNFSVI